MLSDECTWPWGHWLFFDLGQAPTPRLAVIMVKREPAPIDNRRREGSLGWREYEENPENKRLGRWRIEFGDKFENNEFLGIEPGAIHFKSATITISLQKLGKELK
ncbi:hypothetical protein TNCV_2656411 [Trichonephila clavipes]|nr:hypothetical protein TNCV_2656411 [Trichonephila clavipes]